MQRGCPRARVPAPPDGWSRFLYETGSEVTVDKHFRFELKVSRLSDVLPENSAVNAVGLVAKWYY